MTYLVAFVLLASALEPAADPRGTPHAPSVCLTHIEALGLKKQKIDGLEQQLLGALSTAGIKVHRLAAKTDVCPIPCRVLPSGVTRGDLRLTVSVVRVGTVLQWTLTLDNGCATRVAFTRAWVQDAGASGTALMQVMTELTEMLDREEQPPPVLTEIPAASVAAPGTLAAPTDPPPAVDKSIRPAPLLAWGLGALGLVVGVVFGIETMNDKSSYDKNPEAFTVDKRDAMARHQLTANVGYGAAILGAGVGTLLWFWD